MGRGLRWFLGALVLLVACSQTRTEEEQAGSQGSGAAALAFLDRVRASHASRGAHMPSLALASQSDVRRRAHPRVQWDCPASRGCGRGTRVCWREPWSAHRAGRKETKVGRSGA